MQNDRLILQKPHIIIVPCLGVLEKWFGRHHEISTKIDRTIQN